MSKNTKEIKTVEQCAFNPADMAQAEGKGISPYPVSAVSKTRLQDQESAGIVCQLYEVRKVIRLKINADF